MDSPTRVEPIRMLGLEALDDADRLGKNRKETVLFNDGRARR